MRLNIHGGFATWMVTRYTGRYFFFFFEIVILAVSNRKQIGSCRTYCKSRIYCRPLTGVCISYSNYKVEEDEVGGTCGTNGGEEERVYVIGRKARGKETTRKTEA
jgi:glyoxylate utilization-related uncharacterized protein